MAGPKINQDWPWPRALGSHGTFPEEVKPQPLETNPEAAPLAESGPLETLLPSRSSEHLRLGDPSYALRRLTENAQAFVLIHSVLRQVLMRRRKKGWEAFDDAVEGEDLDDLPSTRRSQMKLMAKREKAMLGKIEEYNRMAEAVYAQLLSGSQG